jgi:hypothetical protein
MSDLLFDPSHMVFETDGTCYDLVLTNDPYGGVLVIWPATGYVWRWHPGDRLKPLTRDLNHHDGNNIFEYLEGTQ